MTHFGPPRQELPSSTRTGPLNPLMFLTWDLGGYRVFVSLQQYWTLLNSLGECLRPSLWTQTINEIVDLREVSDRVGTSLFDLLKVGERHANMARIFNLRRTDSRNRHPS